MAAEEDSSPDVLNSSSGNSYRRMPGRVRHGLGVWQREGGDAFLHATADGRWMLSNGESLLACDGGGLRSAELHDGRGAHACGAWQWWYPIFGWCSDDFIVSAHPDWIAAEAKKEAEERAAREDAEKEAAEEKRLRVEAARRAADLAEGRRLAEQEAAERIAEKTAEVELLRKELGEKETAAARLAAEEAEAAAALAAQEAVPKQRTVMVILPDGRKKKLKVAAESLEELQRTVCTSYDLPAVPASRFEIFDNDFDDWLDFDEFGALGETGKLRISIVGDNVIRFSVLTEADAHRMFNESAGSRFQVRRIQSVVNDKLTAMLTNYMQVLEDRRKNPGGVFNCKLHEDPAVRAAKDALLAKMKYHFKTKTMTAAGMQRANILPVWHGLAGGEAVADQITSTGFASLAFTDDGYYGHGIYTALQALYACLYSSEYPRPVAPDANGDWVVLLCIAVVGMTYPITHCGQDFTTWPPTQGAPSNWYGYPLKSGFDSHLVGVKGPDYLPVDADQEEFHELVLKQDAQVVPVMKVYFCRK